MGWWCTGESGHSEVVRFRQWLTHWTFVSDDEQTQQGGLRFKRTGWVELLCGWLVSIGNVSCEHASPSRCRAAQLPPAVVSPTAMSADGGAPTALQLLAERVARGEVKPRGSRMKINLAAANRFIRAGIGVRT